jgi:hypothetical protein
MLIAATNPFSSFIAYLSSLVGYEGFPLSGTWWRTSEKWAKKAPVCLYSQMVNPGY